MEAYQLDQNIPKPSIVRYLGTKVMVCTDWDRNSSSAILEERYRFEVGGWSQILSSDDLGGST